jgi:oligopeptide/dipeptide ABC transporter ATP-binding protein
MKKLLEVKKLNVTFSSRGEVLHAVRGLDFSLYESEIVGIVGESGCGKSAAVKSLTQLNPRHTTLTQGNILYEGRDLLTCSERQMRQVRGKEIGMIFQDPMTSLNPTMKIGEQIMEGYLQHFPKAGRKKAKQRALTLLHEVGIPAPDELFNAYPHTLSGGMRQRVMIALALACEPKILLADEPTTALDVTIQAQILHLLKKLQETTKISILLITHDMSIIANLCDRVLVMYAGKIVENTTSSRLFSSPQHPYTKKLLAAIPRLDQPKTQRLLSIEGRPPHLTHAFLGCGFCSRCDEAMAICQGEDPPLFEPHEEHFSACFKHDPRCSP